MDATERAWRAEFPITERLVYLNNCSLTPLHERGRKRIERFAQEWSDWGGRAWYDHWIGEYETLREELAGVLGASPDEVAIEPNVSAGLLRDPGPLGSAERTQGVVCRLHLPPPRHPVPAGAPPGRPV